jgi:hypothetical protein
VANESYEWGRPLGFEMVTILWKIGRVARQSRDPHVRSSLTQDDEDWS